MRRHIFLILILESFLIGFINLDNFIYAQENGISLEISSNFEMVEYSELIGVNENVISFDIELQTPNWTISDLEINFTNIKMNSEVKVIESEATGFEILRGNYNEILGMQLNITESTRIYSIEIYGYKILKSSSPTPVYVRIEGWNSITGRPNGTIYSSPLIVNMTEGIPRWNLQKFQTPVDLDPGYYCIVLDGTEISSNDKYFWYINNENPTSQLSMCLYNEDTNTWETRIGDVFLHKIKQRINRSYIPSKINMTAEIDNELYAISDKPKIGTGSLSINNLDLLVPDTNLKIYFRNNNSISLLVNFSFQIFINHFILSEGLVEIKEGLDNKWIVSPEFNGIHSNISVTFHYPKSWYNLTIYRNDINITSEIQVNLNDNIIFISNDFLNESSVWSISAYSPNVNFSLNVPKTSFMASQDLKFSVVAPIVNGKITYILIDSLGFEEFSETKNVISSEILFCYNLSANPIEGIYKAYVFWYNCSDAGIKTQEFSIDIPFTIELWVIISVILIIFVISGGTLTGYLLVKRKRSIKRILNRKFFNKFTDVLNLNYFIISEKNSGLTVYEHFFSGKSLDTSLISGFLQAVRAFGIEITDANEQSRSIKLDYQNSKILMSDYKNLRIILIMSNNPSHDFLESLNALSYEIEEKYSHLLEQFDGDITNFKNIRKILDSHLYISLVSPLKLMSVPRRLSSEENLMINQVRKLMKGKSLDYFYVLSLQNNIADFQINDAKVIFSLIQKGVFQPLNKNSKLS